MRLPCVQDEITPPDEIPLTVTGQGPAVRRVQEWCSLHGTETSVDGIFGPATAQAVSLVSKDLTESLQEHVGETLWRQLVAPLRRATTKLRYPPQIGAPETFKDALSRVCTQHLEQGPRELPPNKGPWVRAYMRGQDGEAYAWCAGAATTLIEQAARDFLGNRGDAPLGHEISVDRLAQKGKDLGRFVREDDVSAITSLRRKNPPALFLLRKRSHDWVHTGIVTKFGESAIETVEGNSNQEGAREGIELLRRTRDYRQLDFIDLTP